MGRGGARENFRVRDDETTTPVTAYAGAERLKKALGFIRLEKGHHPRRSISLTAGKYSRRRFNGVAPGWRCKVPDSTRVDARTTRSQQILTSRLKLRCAWLRYAIRTTRNTIEHEIYFMLGPLGELPRHLERSSEFH